MKMTSIQLGKVIKQARKKKGLTLLQCATELDISKSMMFFIENGTRTCSDLHREKLSSVLGNRSF